MMLDGKRISGEALWAVGDDSAVVRRVWVATIAIGSAAALATLAAGRWRDAVGMALGLALALVNFRSLHNSLKSIIDEGHERAPSGSTAMFVFRWIITGTVAFAVARSGAATLVGVFCGLFAPAAAIGLEAIYQTAAALRGEHDGES